jgi:hypothetical protein
MWCIFGKIKKIYGKNMQNVISYQYVHLRNLECLIDYAFYNAIKYRFDPVVGKIHSDYLELVKDMKKEILKENENAK